MSDVATEKITLLLDGNVAQSAGASAIAVERLDSGLAKVMGSTSAVGRAVDRFEAALKKEGATAEEVGAAFDKMTQAVDRYDTAMDRKKATNRVLMEAKAEAESADKAYNDALDRQKKHNDELRAEQKYNDSVDKKREKYNNSIDKKRRENRFRMEADDGEKNYQAALKRQNEHDSKLRDGHDPTKTGSKVDRPRKQTFKQRAFQSIGKAFGPNATQAIGNTADMLEKIGPIAAKLGHPLAIAAAAMGAVGVAAVGAGIYAAKEFGGAVIQAQGFRENMQLALKTIAGSDAKANSIIERATSTADYLGKKHADTVGQFTTLMGKGFDVDTTDNLMRKLGDLKVRNPGAQFEPMVLALGQINSKGKLATEELNQLIEAGLGRKDFMAELATQTGKGIDDLEKDLQAGKVSSEQFMKAFLATGNKDGGPLGALANEASRNNIEAIIERVKSIPENFLFGAKAGPGMEETKATLNSLLDWFDVSKGKGKEVQKVVGDLFNALVEGLTGNKVDTKKGITGTLDALLEGAQKAVPYVYALASGANQLMGLAVALMEGAGAAGDFTDKLGGVGTIWKGLSLPIRMATAALLGPLALLPELYQGFLGFEALLNGDTKGAKEHFMNMLPGGELLTQYGSQIDAMLDVGAEGLRGIGTSIKTTASTLMNEAIGIGTSVIDGLVQGIMSGASRAWEAISSVGTGIIDTISGVLQRNSPSKVMIDIGKDTTGGLPLGITKEAPSAYAAANDVGTGVVASMMAGMKPANSNGMVATMLGTPRASNSNGSTATQSAFATSANTSSGMTLNVTFAPVIKADGGRSEAENRAAAAAAVAGSQEEFDRMLAVSVRRMRKAGGM